VTPPRIGSLFSGYGGLDLAVQAVYGAETAWHCQYEPPDKKTGRPDPQFAAAVLAHHWPSVPNLGDITAVDWDQVLADHGRVDILTGGFPCTDVSLAGKRAGLNDQTRSGLWAHMARAIAVFRPKLVVIENVRGLLSAPADSDVQPCTWCLGDGADEPVLRALGAVLADLAQLGFDAEWIGLPAAGVGAPHERFRVFVYAWPADTAGPGLEDRREGRPGRGLAVAADTDVLGTHRSGARGAGRDEPADHGVAAAHTHRDGVRHEPVAECRGSGPAVAQLVGADAAAHTDRGGLAGDGELPPGRDTVRPRVRADADRCDPAPADAGGGRRRPAERDVQPGEPDTAWGPYAAAVARWEHVVGRPAPRPTDAAGRLSPLLTEWMMGLPDGWLTAVPAPSGMTASQVRNAQLKAAGNGVVPQQAEAALRLLHHRALTPV